MSLNDAKKRDFVTQMIEILVQNKSKLADKGFSTESKETELKEKAELMNTSEVKQQEAAAAAKEATLKAQTDLDAAYLAASSAADAVVGLLGKDDELSKKIRKIRK